MANPLFDPSTDNQNLHPEHQERVNTAIAGGSIDPADQAFLEDIKIKLENGTIKSHTPSSLINHAVYDQLPAELQGRADLKAMNMLSKIRQLMSFHKLDMDTAYQEQNLLHSLRLDKEHMENEIGDVFVI